MTPRARFIQEVGAVAYLACLEAGKVKRRTARFGLSRETYNVEYAHAAAKAVRDYLYQNLPASAIEARRAETQGGAVADESATRQGDAR